MKNVKGFILVETLVLLAVVALIGGALWFWQSQKEVIVSNETSFKIDKDQIPVNNTTAESPTVTDDNNEDNEDVENNNNPITQNTTNQDNTTPDTSGWQTYNNTEYGFSLKHPNYDSECCKIAGPQNAKELIVLADPNSATAQGTDKPFDGMGLFVEQKDPNETFSSYIESKKAELLISSEAYTGQTIVDHSNKDYSAANQQGIILINYAWWADMLFLPTPNDNQILIFAKTEEATGSFNETFDQILETLEFSS